MSLNETKRVRYIAYLLILTVLDESEKREWYRIPENQIMWQKNTMDRTKEKWLCLCFTLFTCQPKCYGRI